MTKRSVKEILALHGARLTDIPGVIGVTEGWQDDDTPCILVLVEALSETLDAQLPGRLEGHPVKVQVLGDVEELADPDA